ncbi:DMT family transporter [Luteimonas lutimaris]|uniref:DMT family transporter n=1 Tax=Luteimonas lutimaris TaxID=698645 RepID=A0ABP7MJU6_9GAMM
MPKPVQRNAVLALLLLAAIWSYNWIVMKQVLRWSGPFEFSAWRYALGTLVLFAALRLRGVSLRPPPLLPVLLVGLSQTMAFQALVQWALVDGGAGKTALLAYMMPFWAVPVAWLALRERPTGLQLASIAVALAGLLLVLEPWHGLGVPGSAALAIGGGACWAIGMVLSKRLFQRGEAGLLSLTAWQMLVGSLGLVVIAACVDERGIEWNVSFVAALAYNAVLASGLAWLLWSYVVERVPTSVAGLSSLLVPVLGVLLAWVLLGEAPSLSEAAGIALVAVALLVVGTRGKRDGDAATVRKPPQRDHERA